MNTKEKIPYRFRNIFNTWEEYRDWCIEKSKEELKIENFYSTNYKKSITAAVETKKILRDQLHGKTGNGNGY